MNIFTDIFKIKLEGDKVIWRIFFIFAIISLLAVYTASYMKAAKSGVVDREAFDMLIKHAVGFLIGFAVMYFVHKRDYRIIYRWSIIILIASFILVALLYTSLGVSKNEAVRWVNLYGISFQPSEFAKFALIVYIARRLAEHQKDIANKKAVLYPIAGVTLIMVAFLWKSGFSTVLFLVVIAFVMLILGRVPWKQLLAIIGLGLVMAFIVLGLALKSPSTLGNRGGTIQTRLTTFMPALKAHANIVTTLSDHENTMQQRYAKTAVALGKKPAGPGNSIMKKRLAESESDFIFSIIIEEYSVVAALILVSLYLILLFRAGRIMRKCEYSFPALLVMGLAFYIVFQGFIHMGINVSLLPVTGQTLPFVSWGSTSLIISCLSLGMILSISKEVDAQKPEAAKAAEGEKTKKEKPAKQETPQEEHEEFEKTEEY
ncbi:MAG: FtsW/RodA/SpoVE family cell cycle protein [Bacteroidales bacterium]|jgi:cell division protein FtsW|nr:FtsW/RodA/SpoVE family cell cycle protein [Bacteroidales bacterium]